MYWSFSVNTVHTHAYSNVNNVCKSFMEGSSAKTCCNFRFGTIFLQIYIWQFTDGDLSGIAFIDTQIYIHTITTLKNLILIGDIAKSVSLLRLQEENKVLSLVSRVRILIIALYLSDTLFSKEFQAK